MNWIKGFFRHLLLGGTILIAGTLGMRTYADSIAPPNFPESKFVLPQQLTFRGVGDVAIGATSKQLTALGYSLVVSDRGVSVKDLPHFSCTTADFFIGGSYPIRVEVLLRAGKVSRIGVFGQPGVATKAGVKIDSTEEDVRRLYGRQLLIFNTYSYTGDSNGNHSLVVKSPDGKMALVMETEKGRVTSMHVGPKEEFWIESDGKLWIPDPTTIREVGGVSHGPTLP